MSYRLGTLPIIKNIPTQFVAPFTGLKAIIISNQSGLTCTVTMIGGNLVKTLHPGTSDWFPVNPGFTGMIGINPQPILTNPSSWTSSSLTFDAVGANDTENAVSYPLSLPVPAVTPTASGKPNFSATVGFPNTATFVQSINIFNPANSNVNMTFYSARVFATCTSFGSGGTLGYFQGSDLNIGTTIPITSHTLVPTPLPGPPVSVGHATSFDGTLVLPPNGVTIEALQIPPNTLTDFLLFPDSLILTPGGNLKMNFINAFSNIGDFVRFTLKWTEDTLS